ncbi:AraC family ligand binding domain-containing protein, partial [Bacteroides caecimuris]
MKESIPMHLHRDITEAGIYQKIVTSENLVPHPIEYVHRDDYFILGLIVRGTVCIDIDFERQTISEGEIGLIRPGQVHRFVGGDDFEGWMFMIESGVVSDRYKLIFEKTSLSGNTLWLPNKEINELKTLYHLIYNLGEREEDMFIMRNLASAFVGIVAGYFKRVNSRQNSYNSRHAEIVLQLNSLLQTDITESHSPSYYADKL